MSIHYLFVMGLLALVIILIDTVLLVLWHFLHGTDSRLPMRLTRGGAVVNVVMLAAALLLDAAHNTRNWLLMLLPTMLGYAAIWIVQRVLRKVVRQA